MKNKRERLNEIINILRIEGESTLELLAGRFQVSTATIRRDIKLLEGSGQVMQTVGGGILFKRDYHGPAREDLLVKAIQEKVRIAEFCTTLVSEHETILLGPGVITNLTGRILGGLSCGFRLITNMLPLAMELAGVENIKTVILGGEVSGTISDGFKDAELFHRTVPYADKLFLTADGIDPEHGLTYFDADPLPLLRSMIEAAREIILIADAGNFERICFNHLMNLDGVSRIITDSGLSEGAVRSIEKMGIPLERV